MVDIGDLKSLVRIGRAGSSPVSGTIYRYISTLFIKKSFFILLILYIHLRCMKQNLKYFDDMLLIW